MNLSNFLPALALSTLVLGSPSVVWGADLCIPSPVVLSELGDSPAWTGGMGTVITDFDDPRWTAPLSPFASDTAGQSGSYRIQRSADGTKLFVQVRTSQDHDPPNNPDRVYFGISKDDVGVDQNPLAFGFQFVIGAAIPVSNPQTNVEALQLRGYDYDSSRAADAKWSNASGKPVWITSPALWSKAPVVSEGEPVDWGVAFVVDLTSLPTPISSTDAFKIVLGLNTVGQDDPPGEPTVTRLYTPAPPAVFFDEPSNTAPFVEEFPTIDWLPVLPTESDCSTGITLNAESFTINDGDGLMTAPGEANVLHIAPDKNGYSYAPAGMELELRLLDYSSPEDGVTFQLLPDAFSLNSDASGNFEYECPPNTESEICGVPIPDAEGQCLYARIGYGPGYSHDNAPYDQAAFCLDADWQRPADPNDPSSGGAGGEGPIDDPMGTGGDDSGSGGDSTGEPGASGGVGAGTATDDDGGSRGKKKSGGCSYDVSGPRGIPSSWLWAGGVVVALLRRRRNLV